MGVIVSRSSPMINNDSPLKAPPAIALSASPPLAFTSSEFRLFTIREIKQISSDTKLFRINLPSQDHIMGLTVASSILIKRPSPTAAPDGNPVIKPYTPTSMKDQRGYFDLVVKVYPNGIVSGYLYSLQVGDSIEVKGPIMKFKYIPNAKKRIGMIAGGTGITPMLQIINEIIQNPSDQTKVTLLFANHSEEDILLKDELETIVQKYSNIQVTYVLSTPKSDTWKGERGRIDDGLIVKYLPKPDNDILIFVCGPDGFMESISGNKTIDKKQGSVSGLLKNAGYTEDMVFKF